MDAFSGKMMFQAINLAFVALIVIAFRAEILHLVRKTASPLIGLAASTILLLIGLVLYQRFHAPDAYGASSGRDALILCLTLLGCVAAYRWIRFSPVSLAVRIRSHGVRHGQRPLAPGARPEQRPHAAETEGPGRSVVAAPAVDPQRLLIAVANFKGGTGKSTVALNVGCGLAERGRRVLIVDNDPQGTCHAWAGGSTLPVECVRSPVGSAEEVADWADRLERLRGQHDVTVVDLPASVALALGAVLATADLVLIPTSPSEMEIVATRRVLSHIVRSRAERSGRAPGVLLVPTRVVDLERGLESTAGRLARLGEEIAPPLRQCTTFHQAFARGQWVGAFQPNSAAHGEVRALVDAVLQRLERSGHAMTPAAA